MRQYPIGTAIERSHTHLFSEVTLSTEDFDVCRCSVCGHSIMVTRDRHRQATGTEETLIDRVVFLETALGKEKNR